MMIVNYFKEKCTADELSKLLKLVNQKHLPSVVCDCVPSSTSPIKPYLDFIHISDVDSCHNSSSSLSFL